MKSNHYTKEKIYDLLPSIYRIRDKEVGEPLKALLEIIGEQVEIVEQDIEQLYRNWFIETCDEWLVPYIGDLLQAKILNPVTSSTSSQRSWVANTISYRRRKGTLATLEQLSRDVTGWNCKAVEFFQNLITTQYLNHLRLESKGTINMRDNDLLEKINTPFDKSAHTLDVRHINSKRGYYNITNIGIFLWRLQAYPVIDAPAFSLDEGKFTFSQLGYDLPIYNQPENKTSIDHIATELNIPTKIRRTSLKRALKDYLETSGSEIERKFAYQKSIKIIKSVLVESENGEVIILKKQILPEDLIVCNLSSWNHRPPEEKVAIDPEYGRLVFPETEKVVDVHVSYYYGFSGDLGGGFYDRKELDEKESTLTGEMHQDFYHYKISKKNHGDTFPNINEALEKWKTEPFHNSRDVIFEIIDSEVYTDKENNGNSIIPIEIKIPPNVSVIFRSQNLYRPIYVLNKGITVTGVGSGSRITFEGILFVFAADLHVPPSSQQLYDNNNTILKVVKGNLSELIINHCTIVPGRIEPENEVSQQLRMGRLLFTWENIPQIKDDVDRLKSYLFDILNEEWILGDGVVLDKVQPDNNIIKISPNNTENSSIILELDNSLDSILIKTRDAFQDELPEEYHTIYKLLTLHLNDLTNVYVPLYSVGIFGNSVQESINNIIENSTTNNNSLKISVNRSILGRIDSISSGASLKIVDSIIDGKGDIEAMRCANANIENATIFGRVSSLIIERASNSIFTDIVNIDRRQQGCVRFCYIPTGSQIPRPYRCVFESSDENIAGTFINNGGISGAISALNNPQVLHKIIPKFSSKRYGDDGYGQLHRDVHKAIFDGGDNSSEMGAFNHLYNPQRIKNLLFCIDEYLKFGLEAGTFLVT